MKFHSTDKVRLVMPKAALITVFDECDGFDQDETGGRVIGTYKEHKDKLDIRVTGIIEAGPQAQRSAVSFFQDCLVTRGFATSGACERAASAFYWRKTRR